MDSVVALHPVAPGYILSAPKNFCSLKLLRFIEETAKNTGQRLDNVNQTHIVLASVELMLQKSRKCHVFKIVNKNNIFEKPFTSKMATPLFTVGTCQSFYS